VKIKLKLIIGKMDMSVPQSILTGNTDLVQQKFR